MGSEARRTKLVRDLSVGDLIIVTEPAGVGRITRKEPSRLFKADGGCFRIDARIVKGPNKGKDVRDQHLAGNDSVELAPTGAQRAAQGGV